MNPMQPLLLVSYGAPECVEEVVPFLNNLFAGKEVSAQRRAAAIQKYEQYAAKTGHYSPLNAECRKLIDGIRRECSSRPNLCTKGRGETSPVGAEPLVYWGNLFGNPLLVDTISEMARNGVQRAVCFTTSAFDSPSGNQHYIHALESARRTVGKEAPILKILPLLFDHPLFIEAQTDRLLDALAQYHVAESTMLETASNRRQTAAILFSAHSIPSTDNVRCRYVEQLQTTCRTVIEKGGTSIPWELVYQSRSGPTEHWLTPDIKERVGTLAAEQIESVIVSPMGFFCENMETEYDLDIEIGELCAKLGLNFYRAKAVGGMPTICRLIAELAFGSKSSQ